MRVGYSPLYIIFWTFALTKPPINDWAVYTFDYSWTVCWMTCPSWIVYSITWHTITHTKFTMHWDFPEIMCSSYHGGSLHYLPSLMFWRHKKICHTHTRTHKLSLQDDFKLESMLNHCNFTANGGNWQYKDKLRSTHSNIIALSCCFHGNYEFCFIEIW